MSIKYRETSPHGLEVVPTSDAGLKAVAFSVGLAFSAMEKGEVDVPANSWLARYRFRRTAKNLANEGAAAYDTFARRNTMPSVIRGNGEGKLPVEQAERLYVAGYTVSGEVGLELLQVGAPLAKAKEKAAMEALAPGNWMGDASHHLWKRANYNEVYFPILDQLAELEVPRFN